MRKSALLLAIALAASFSTAAMAAKKKAAPPDPAIQAQADTAAFLNGMLHPATSGDGLPAKAKRAKKG